MLTRILRNAALGATRLLGLTLYHAGLARAVIALRRRQARVLVYHACEPTEDEYLEGLASNTPPAVLARQLEAFSRLYRIVPLETLATADRPERALAITFDDGYASVFSNAMPVLRRHAIPATVFLISRAVDDGTIVWVNELNALLRRSPAALRAVREAMSLSAEADAAATLARVRDHAPMERVAELLSAARSAASGEGTRVVPRTLYLTWEQILELSSQGIAFGNHTASHPNLRLLPAAAITAELGECQQHLAERLGAIHAFAFPFGATDERARDAAAALGCTIAAEIGLASGTGNGMRLGRVPVAGQSPAALFADLEVTEPIKAALRAVAQRLLR